MDDKKYIVIEMQVYADGTAGFPPIATYSSRNEAEAAYFTKLAVAALSNVYKHTITILDDEGTQIMKRTYIHVEDTNNVYS